MKHLLTALPLLLSTTAHADSTELMVEAWSHLRYGQLDQAQADFETAHAKRRTLEAATAGLLAVALARGDDDAMAALLEDLKPKRASGLLVVAAGAAELSLRRSPERALIWAEAACELEYPALADDVEELCSWAPLLREAEGFVRTDHAEALALPFSYAGAQPVVLAGVNGGEPVPLLVDTGASTCLLTEQAAEELGLHERSDTALQVTATGGPISSWRDLVELELAGAAVQDVPVIVADLPIAGLAGILSPQALWPDRVVELDFSRHELRLAAAGEAELEGVVLPWRQHAARPYIELAAPDLPPRPMVIDTGATTTHLDQKWAGGTDSLELGDVHRTEGAGGARAEVIATEGTLAAQAGELSFPLTAPNLYDAPRSGGPWVWNHGLLGAEAWMGRTLSLDRTGRRIAFTDPPALPPWEPGDAARFEVTRHGEVVGAFTERVHERDDGTVTLEVTIERQDEEPYVFFLITPDGWASRGGWMFTRPPAGAYVLDPQGERQALEDMGKTAWMSLFEPFRTVPGDEAPGLLFGTHEITGRALSCTRLELPAQVGEQLASFAMLECPADPWRVASIQVRDDTDTVIWGFERVE